MDGKLAQKGGTVSLARYVGALVCVGIFAADLTLLLPLLSIRLAEDGHSPVEISVLGACAASGGLVAPLVVTRLARRIRLTRMAVLALLVLPVTVLLFRITEGRLAVWYAIYVANAIGIALVFIVSETLIISSSMATRRGLAVGIYCSTYSLGCVIGPALLAASGTEGWTPYLVCAALPFSAALIFLLVPSMSDGDIELAGEEKARIRDVFPLMYFAMVCAFTHGAIEITTLNLFPVYAGKTGYSASETAVLLTMIGLGSMIFTPIVGWLLGRARLMHVMAVVSAMLVGGVPLMYLGVVTDMPLLKPLLVLWGGALGSVYLIGIFSVAMRFKGLRLVTASAIFNQMFSLGLFAGPVAGGFLMEHVHSPHGLLVLWAGLGVVPFLSCWLMSHNEFIHGGCQEAG